MRLYMKIGAMPAGYVDALRIRKAPALKQVIEVREMKNGKPQRILISLIKNVMGQNLYFGERM